MSLKDILKIKDKRIYACKKSLLLFSLYYFTKYHTFKIPQFHKDFYKDLEFKNIIGAIWITFRESAKRQPLDANILTPNGWRLMGELQVGDEVVGADGKSTKIEYISETVDRPIYQIETEDGRKTECDLEHYWTVRKMTNVKEKVVTMTAQELLDAGLYYDRKPDYRNGKKYKEYKFAIDTVKPIEFKAKELPVEPYFLGLWLGDGTSSSVDITNIDKEIEEYLDEYASRIGLKLKVSNHDGLRATTLSITRGYTGGINRYSLQGELRKLDVLNNKHIPEKYLFGSIEQRKALLEGLMDSDGTVSSGTASFSNQNERLVDDVIKLVRSLGGRVKKTKAKTHCYYNGNKVVRDYYRLSILFTDYTPFRLSRKRKAHKKSNHTFSRIVDIKLVGNKKGRCIKVANEDGLYVTDDYLLTHNTSLAKIKIIHAICYQYKHFIIWTSFDQSKAKANLFDIALELQTNKRLIADFGQLFFGNKEEKKSEKKSIGEFITENNIKVKAYSTGQTPRGEVHGEFRPDLIVLDDIETMQTAESEAKTEQVIKYIDELLSGLGNTANILILANRIVFGGTISYLEDRLKADNDFVIRDIAVIEDGEIVWTDKYVHTDEEAEKINKDIEDRRHHKVSLETKKRLLGHQVYNREMLNTPITDEEREFKRDWFKERPRADVDRLNTRKFLTIDTAMSEKESADFTGFCENYIDQENFWNLSAYKMKLNPKDLVDYLFTLHAKRSFEKIGIEKTTFTEGLKPYLEEEMRKRNAFLPIVELSHGGTKKETRIRGLIPRYSNKSIYHITGECKDLEQELYNFPKSLHDDVSDATAYQLQIAEENISQFNKLMDSNESSYSDDEYE